MLSDCDIIGLVLHFRTSDLTSQCVRSLVTEGINRVVLVDNSEDGGYSIICLEPLFRQLKMNGVVVDVLRPIVNLGFSKGVTFGLDYIANHSPGHVLLINSDATIERGGLQAMLPYLGKNACITLPRRQLMGQGLTSSIRFYHKPTALLLRHPLTGTVAYPCGCCLLLQRELAFSKLFDCDFFLYGEDVMAGFEFARRGIAFVECTESAVIHFGSASASNGSLFYEYHMARAHWLLAKKLARSRWETVLFVVARCITLPLRACLRAIRSRSLVPFLGLIAATFDVTRGRRRAFTPTGPSRVDGDKCKAHGQ